MIDTQPMCLTGLDMYQGPIDYEAIDDDGIECNCLLKLTYCISMDDVFLYMRTKGRMMQPSIGW